MSNSAKRKERQRRKRQEKRTASQRSQSGSVYRRIGEGGEMVACYINRNWRDQGIASIHVLKRIPGGGLALCAFLVDVWCMGLKDAWGRLDYSMEEFRGMLDRVPAEVDLVRVDFDLVRKLVAGGTRFARQNGFRLPPKYERWTAMLGALPEPDMNEFGVNGKLRYVGPIRQLRERLVRGSVQEFLNRPEVEFIAEVGEFDPSEETDDYFEEVGPIDEDDADFEEAVERLQVRVLDAVKQWCFAQGLIPHPRLPDVVELTLDSILLAYEEVDEDASEDDRNAAAAVALSDQVADMSRVEVEAISGAMEQWSAFVGQYETPERFAAAMGIDELFD